MMNCGTSNSMVLSLFLQRVMADDKPADHPFHMVLDAADVFLI